MTSSRTAERTPASRSDKQRSYVVLARDEGSSTGDNCLMNRLWDKLLRPQTPQSMVMNLDIGAHKTSSQGEPSAAKCLQIGQSKKEA
jgi:hypothetical protein